MSFIFLALFIQFIAATHVSHKYTFYIIIYFFIAIWFYPYFTTVSLNEETFFDCGGYGDYLNWFIDGVDISNITDEELEARGIKNYTYYYYDYRRCYNEVFSVLLVAGNCLNNKTEVYCVIWFDSYYKLTSSTANLTTKGMVIILLLLLKLS